MPGHRRAMPKMVCESQRAGRVGTTTNGRSCSCAWFLDRSRTINCRIRVKHSSTSSFEAGRHMLKRVWLIDKTGGRVRFGGWRVADFGSNITEMAQLSIQPIISLLIGLVWH